MELDWQLGKYTEIQEHVNGKWAKKWEDVFLVKIV
jgi:hypothetical protein